MTIFFQKAVIAILSLAGLLKILDDAIQAYNGTRRSPFTFPVYDHQPSTGVTSSSKSSSKSTSTRSPYTYTYANGGLCDRIHANESLENIWENALSALEEASLRYPSKGRPSTQELKSNSNFTSWVKESLDYFTMPRLKRSILQLAPTLHMKRVIEILDRRLKHLQTNSSSSSSPSPSPPPPPPPPLHILVTGGSVTAGHVCYQNIFDHDLGAGHDPLCAWPGRLQELLDSLLGPDVVVVTNMAMGGATSAIASLVVEHNLWPQGYPATGPDVIIWDHSPNDMGERTPELEMFESLLQTYYQATRRLRCSSTNDQPLVVYLDSLLGNMVTMPTAYKATQASAAIYRMITWYSDVMGISYARTMRPYVLSNYKREEQFRLLGNRGLFVHPGMMYHITLSWVVLFNLLNSLRDVCNLSSGEEPDAQRKQHPQDWTHDYPASDIPELNSKLQMDQVLPQWKTRAQESKEICSQRNDSAINQCAYLWIANRLTKVKTQTALRKVLQPFMTGDHRWKAEGFPIKKPPLGWTAQGRGAWFELTIPIQDDIIVHQFTLVAMKSYSRNWVNSTLNVTCTVTSMGDNEHQKSRGMNETVVATYPSVTGATNATTLEKQQQHQQQQQHQPQVRLRTVSTVVSGYHELKTSVWFSHRFGIPRATKGDLVTLRFHLVNGETFKISGMALCST